MLRVVVLRTLRGLQFLLFLLVWPYSKFVSLTVSKKKVPPVTNPLLMKRASELAHLIRTQKVTCTEVVKAFIERIKQVEPIINSVVDERFEEALLDAKHVDELLHENGDAEYWAKEKPLLGVPMSFKETVAVAGMSNNGGRLVPPERIAASDCQAVRCLREAGVIPLVVTNTPELCLFWETYNYAKGRTNNPYNTQRTAGGSSGGECALISSGGSVIGLGSDIAGSGRLPAAFCGTCGHKPTPRVISVDSHMPGSEDPDWSRFLVMAPLARYASDLSLILRSAAPKEAVASLKLDQEVNVKNLRIFYMEDCKSHMIKSVNPEIKAAIRKSAMHFKKYGIEPHKVTVNDFDVSLEATVIFMLNMKAPHNVFQRSEDPEDWTMWDVLREVFKKHFFCSKYMAYSIYFGFLKKLAEKTPKSRIESMKKLKSKIAKELEEMLGDDGVLILPVFPDPAHKHYRGYYKMLNTVYLSFFNLMELPATVCPVGLNKEGLPIGVQIVANKHQDRLTLAVASELEKVFGGWVPPSGEAQPNTILKAENAHTWTDILHSSNLRKRQ